MGLEESCLVIFHSKRKNHVFVVIIIVIIIMCEFNYKIFIILLLLVLILIFLALYISLFHFPLLLCLFGVHPSVIEATSGPSVVCWATEV